MAYLIRPFTVHEAQIALFHAWPDGVPVSGPIDRHLGSGIVAAFRAGLTIARTSDGDESPGFGDWRPSRTRPGNWTIETSAPLGAITDGKTEVGSLPPPGTPLVIVVRFLDEDSGQWRFWQFHDAELVDNNAAESSERMMATYRFRAGHREEFLGGPTDPTLPISAPRLRAAIDWCHCGREIRCWDYDAESNAWTERDENKVTVGEDTYRYVTLEFGEEGVIVSYLTPRTEVKEAAAAGLDAAGLGWVDAIAFDVLTSSGLTMEAGWELQTEGCPEPITIPPSARHWQHSKVRFRFLSRLYATLAHGVFAVPALVESNPEYPPFDYPIRLGRLLLLPHTSHVLSE